MGDDSRPSENRTSVGELLRNARAGDLTSREALFEKCRAYIGVVARAQVESWMRTKIDASDLVQQTLLDAHRGLADFQGTTEAEWLAWLKRILAHNAADFVRHYKGTAKREARREVRLFASAGQASSVMAVELPAAVESPSRLAIRQEEEIAVAQAIALLSEDHREVIVLRNLQRLPFEEVAERMGRSGPACQMLWMRAIRSLQEILRQSGAMP